MLFSRSHTPIWKHSPEIAGFPSCRWKGIDKWRWNFYTPVSERGASTAVGMSARSVTYWQGRLMGRDDSALRPGHLLNGFRGAGHYECTRYVKKKTGLEFRVDPEWKTARASRFRFDPTPGGTAGVVIHHTVSNKAQGPMPSENVIVNGRPGLAGPLSQFLLGRGGVVLLVSQNRCNHADKGVKAVLDNCKNDVQPPGFGPKKATDLFVLNSSNLRHSLVHRA